MKRATFHVVLAALFLLATFGAYALWYHALAAARAEADALSVQVSAQDASVAAAQAASRTLADLSSAHEGLARSFIAPDGIVAFLEGLQSLGSGLGTDVAVVSVSANPSPRPHLDLALSVTGPFDAVMKTVGAIEYSPYDLVVKNLTLDTGAGDSGSQWTATLAATVGTASSTPALTP